MIGMSWMSRMSGMGGMDEKDEQDALDEQEELKYLYGQEKVDRAQLFSVLPARIAITPASQAKPMPLKG